MPPTRGYVKFRARVVNPDAMGVIYEPKEKKYGSLWRGTEVRGYTGIAAERILEYEKQANRSVSMIDGHMENETGEEDEG